MDTNPHQLFLLADHIKLSLLERQRADPTSTEAKKQDARIPRSLETLRSGLETLKQRQFDQQAAGEESGSQHNVIATPLMPFQHSRPLGSNITVTSPI